MNPCKTVEKARFGLLCALAVIFFIGCSKPCEEFAQLTCKTAGEDSAACEKAKGYAQRAPGVEQKVCAQALELAHTLKRK